MTGSFLHRLRLPAVSPRSLSNIAITGLLVAGVLCCALRYRSIRRDEAAREETFWELTYTAHFEPTVTTSQQESQVRLALPFETAHCEIVPGRESWSVTDPNLHAKITRPNSKTCNRMLVFSTRKAKSAP